MPLLSAPDTLAVADAIVAFARALTYPGGAPVYSVVQLSEIKDITDNVAGGSACLEVYANDDHSKRHAFGGRIRDEQSWYLLSLVNLDDAQAAEQQIIKVRDVLVYPFQEHATLGNAGSVFHAEILPTTGKFLRVFRNGQFLRAHLIEIFTVSEWQVVPGVIA
jgi:hypothetical protein